MGKVDVWHVDKRMSAELKLRGSMVVLEDGKVYNADTQANEASLFVCSYVGLVHRATCQTFSQPGRLNLR